MNMRRLVLFFLIFAGLGACSKAEMPPTLDRQFEYTSQTAAAYTADLAWWRVYNDPQLNGLVESALTHNLDLAKSAINVNRALYQANLIGADLLPGFSGDLNASAKKDIKHGGSSTRSVGGELAISYELDIWRKVADAASAREWEYSATIEDLLAARLALVNNVVDVYFYLAYLDEAIRYTRDSLENYRRIEEVARVRYSLGKTDALEYAQARQALLGSEGKLIGFETQVREYEETLRNLLNLHPGQTVPVAPMKLDYPDLLEVSSPGVNLDVPLAVLANRPDLMAAEKRVRSAFRDVQAANKSWLPEITLGAGLSSSSTQVRSAFDVPIAAGIIGISLPFLDWNRVYWQVKISEADFESRVVEFEQSITAALNEVDKFYYGYLRAGDRLEIAAAKHEEDAKISSYYQVRYESGAAGLSDWLGALNTENQSRLDLLNAKYSRIEYENALYKAMAGRYSLKL